MYHQCLSVCLSVCWITQKVMDELDQRVIDTAVRQWRTRPRARVKAKGGHLKHKLLSQ